jgi:nicotinamide-nucleotide amidase
MNAEILTIGDEILVGMVTNTNASYLAKEMKSLGINCLYQTTVGDTKTHIIEAIKQAIKRVDLLFITGGLGPTVDDMTVESLALTFGVKQVFHPEVKEQMESIFKAMDKKMPETNLKQAYLPQGARVLTNAVGTAPGIFWDLTDLLTAQSPKIIMVFPGVPKEMVYMWQHQAVPELAQLTRSTLYEKYVNFVGIGESALVEKIGSLMLSEDPKILPYANKYQVQLRVFADHLNHDIARNKVEAAIEEIISICGHDVYGFDDDTLESVTCNLLQTTSKTIALAESCTGGLVSHRLTDVPGSSAYIKLNLVTYANEYKEKELQVPPAIIEKYGAVSEQTARYMAEGVRAKVNTDIGVSVTGIAGPTGGTEFKPVGLVHMALADNIKTLSYRFTINPQLPRTQIKWAFSQYCLNIIRLYLLKENENALLKG